jgi:hypothetical protein
MKVIAVLLVGVLFVQAQWIIDTVETGIANYSKSYIVLDPANDPHIAYLPCYTNNLKYAKWEYNMWRLATVTDDAYTTAGGPTLALCLALSDGAYPYITYTAGTASFQRLKIASYNGVDWDTLHIDGPHAPKASLVLIDSGGPPCVGYQYNTFQKFAMHQGSVWFYDTIGDGSYQSGKVSLYLDNIGTYHYVYDINSYIIYAKSTPTNWVIDTIDQGTYTSMKLDDNNLPCLAYTKPANTDLWYTCYNGSNWVPTQVDTGCGSGPQLIAPSMDLDSYGHVHICYLQQTGTSGIYRLKYAYYNGALWYYEVVDEGFAWHVPSLAVTGSGSVHISYFDGSALLHAYRDPVGIYEKKISTKSDVNNSKITAQPNPFTEYTTIKGSEKSYFKLYDISGRQIGIYEGRQIGANIPAGVYFIKPSGKKVDFLRIIKIQ